MSSCKCTDCGEKGTENEMFYMYRNLRGKSVFTGFVQNKNSEITWIGKDEKAKMKIDTNNQSHIYLFMKQMKQYD